MVGQQMITEARMRNRKARSIALVHPHMHTRHSVPFSSAMMFAFIKPLNAYLDGIMSRFRHSN